MNAFDPHLIQQRFSKAAPQYDQAALVQRQMIEKLARLLPKNDTEHPSILDIGCGTGNGLSMLRTRYPYASLFGLDWAFDMLRQSALKVPKAHLICADMNHLPFKDNGFSLIFSSATLQWSADLQQTLTEFYRVLKPGGKIYLATFGQHTLFELKEAFRQVSLSPASPPPVHDFVDETTFFHHIEKSGLRVAHFIPEKIVIYYDTVSDLLASLKQIGATHAVNTRQKGLMGKNSLKRLYQAYDAFKTAQGFPMTWDIFMAVLSKPSLEIKETEGAF